MKVERFALLLVIVLVIGVPLAAVLARSNPDAIEIHGRMADTGGWTPSDLTAQVGQPLHLRLTSDDVMHGFAVGQSPTPAVDVLPGQWTTTTLMFDQPGKYTFYCTRWCGPNHWRMRGTIEVTGPAMATETVKPPLYVTLGEDIDAKHQAEFIPAERPSAPRGELLHQVIPPAYQSREYYLAHTPVEHWKALRDEPAFQTLTDQDVWDLVAWVWKANTTSQELQMGKQLYAANCAACHGEQGGGNGVFADQLAQSKSVDPTEMAAGDMPVAGDMPTRPANFTDPNTMLSASPAHLQGKFIRGGMGTSMPYWGPILTEDQTWALIAYLWTFQFEMEKIP